MDTIPLFPLAAANAACALLMTGVILFVQIVHYPLMRLVPTMAGIAYAQSHQRRTAIVVAPIMLVELTTGIMLLLAPLASPARILALISAALLAVVWVSTFLVQVPLHARLERAPDEPTVRRLVATNWVRTGAWSARALLGVLILLSVSAP